MCASPSCSGDTSFYHPNGPPPNTQKTPGGLGENVRNRHGASGRKEGHEQIAQHQVERDQPRQRARDRSLPTVALDDAVPACHRGDRCTVWCASSRATVKDVSAKKRTGCQVLARRLWPFAKSSWTLMAVYAPMGGYCAEASMRSALRSPAARVPNA